MSLARRLAAHFVLPAGGTAAAPLLREDFATPREAPDEACASSAARTPTGVAVLTAAPDAPALGAALGLALARLQRAPAAVVCVWSSAPGAWPAWRAPALPAARRLAAGLAVRGHDARPAGRLVVVRLARAGDEAATEARRALVAAGAAAAVLALGGARSPAFDALLGDQDLVVVATRSGTDPLLTQLAVAGLAGARRACACEVPAAAPARSLAAAGVLLAPSARRALAGPLAELSG
jgi:hypothetical protein